MFLISMFLRPAELKSAIDVLADLYPVIASWDKIIKGAKILDIGSKLLPEVLINVVKPTW